MTTAEIVGIVVAALIVWGAGMVVLVRWLRPGGHVEGRRFVIVFAVLTTFFLGLAVAGLVAGRWPVVGFSAFMAIAMALSAVSKARRAKADDAATPAVPESGS